MIRGVVRAVSVVYRGVKVTAKIMIRGPVKTVASCLGVMEEVVALVMRSVK